MQEAPPGPQPTHQTDARPTTSHQAQDRAGPSMPFPETDAEYAALPAVKGPLQPGAVVAYKLLEIGPDWAPQVNKAIHGLASQSLMMVIMIIQVFWSLLIIMMGSPVGCHFYTGNFLTQAAHVFLRMTFFWQWHIFSHIACRVNMRLLEQRLSHVYDCRCQSGGRAQLTHQRLQTLSSSSLLQARALGNKPQL